MPSLSTRIEATFIPARTDDLRAEAVELIGERLEWSYCWVADEGPYAGQAVWMPEPFDRKPYTGWVPDCDLAEVAVLVP